MTHPLIIERREAVLDLVRAFTAVWEGSEWGPAHIVLSDYNLIDEYIISTQQHIHEIWRKEYETFDDHDLDELRATLLFLRILKLIPEDWRDVHDEDDNS